MPHQVWVLYLRGTVERSPGMQTGELWSWDTERRWGDGSFPSAGIWGSEWAILEQEEFQELPIRWALSEES